MSVVADGHNGVTSGGSLVVLGSGYESSVIVRLADGIKDRKPEDTGEACSQNGLDPQKKVVRVQTSSVEPETGEGLVVVRDLIAEGRWLFIVGRRQACPLVALG